MIRAKHTIRHSGMSYKKGALIQGLTEAEEKRLIKLKSAEYVITPDEEIQQQQQSEKTFTVNPEKFTELAEALDSLYNADELKREAKEVGVDLTGITKKDDVIAAIINQGKADELLEDEEPDNVENNEQ